MLEVPVVEPPLADGAPGQFGRWAAQAVRPETKDRLIRIADILNASGRWGCHE